MRYYSNYGYNYEDSFFWKLVDWARELCLCFLGIVLIFGASLSQEWINNSSAEKLSAFVNSVARGNYDALVSEGIALPDGVSVHELEKKSGTRNYYLDVTCGTYRYRGSISYGYPSNKVTMEEIEHDFWETPIVLDFAGKLCVILGIAWFVAKRALGIKSFRELHYGFYVGQY